jgi:hypothetical protein
VNERPSVTVSIECLSIRGVSVPNRERLGTSLARELTRLIERDDRPEPWTARRIDTVAARPVALGRRHPDALARALAAAVYREMRT